MKKGFTLIELLAVIVILAIIAIIAIPTITKVVEKAKKGAAESSALNYIDAVEKYIMLHDVNPEKYPYDLKNGTFSVAESTEVSLLDIIVPKANANETVPALNNIVTVKGDKPTSGSVTTNAKGKVTSADLTMRGYSITCDGDECTAAGGSGGGSTPVQVTLSIIEPESTSFRATTTLTLETEINSSDEITWTSSDTNIATVSNGVVTGVKPGSVTITASIGNVEDTIDLTVKGGATKVASPSGATHKGIVYLNPSNGSIYTECTTAPSGSASSTGCMKWYIFAEDDTNNTYTMILDHNIQNGVVWNSSNSAVAYASSGAKTVIDNLNWDSNIIEKRIISATEVDTITGGNHNNEWYYLNSRTNSGGATGTGTSAYAWLYDYTKDCTSYGCNSALNDNGAIGYWTSDTASSSHVWYVDSSGYLGYTGANRSTSGVRPVIKISKSLLAS